MQGSSRFLGLLSQKLLQLFPLPESVDVVDVVDAVDATPKSYLRTPPILRRHCLGMRPAACQDDLDKRLHVNGHAQQLQAQPRALGSEDGILSPVVALKANV